MDTILGQVGFVIAVLGILVEGLATTAMVSIRVRRAMPCSPFVIVTVGILYFFGGMILLAGMHAS